VKTGALAGCETSPEQRYICPLHGEYTEITPCVNFLGKPADPFCPKCNEEQKAREAEAVERQKRREIISRYEGMNIDKRFWECTFENFDAYNDELKRHLATAKRFAGNPDGNLVMIGENGNGKNHLAISILKKTGGLIHTCYEMGVMLRDSYNSSEAMFFDMVCNTPLLVIDEVDKIKETEAKINWLSHIIGKRYNRVLPTIFIANGHLQEDCKSPQKPCGECLQSHLENDVISRIVQKGFVLKFTSPDYRYKTRFEGGK
jgi:DNA replication protein DnaC